MPENRRAAVDIGTVLLPAMCLNRYYVAEGVRVFSQETWRLAVGDRGVSLVADRCGAFVSHYIEQSKANNHAVREAACACLAEIAAKVPKERHAEHTPAALSALLSCFRDESWPVRDAACVACERLVRACPDEVPEDVREELWRLFVAHLWDNIPSVRADSARALGACAEAWGPGALARCWAALDDALPRAKSQPSDSQRYGSLADGGATFGVAGPRRTRANDVAAHTDQTLFSCGSLAPKLRRGAGCIDHGFKREREPWEASEGALRLLAVLAPLDPVGAGDRLGLVAELAALDTFTHAPALWEAVAEVLPTVARAVGPRPLRPQLDALTSSLVRVLSCGARRAEHAAGAALGALRDVVGAGVFAGRLSQEQAAALAVAGDLVPAPPPTPIEDPAARDALVAAARAAAPGGGGDAISAALGRLTAGGGRGSKKTAPLPVEPTA